MNAIFEHIKAYCIACFALAMLYALPIGELPIILRFADGVIYGIVLLVAGHILWHVFRYAIPSQKQSGYQYIVLFTLSILTSCVLVGTESFALYLCFPSYFSDFAPSIPGRLFISLLLFIIFRLFYIVYSTERNGAIDACESSTQTAVTDRITVRNGQKIKIIPVNDIHFLRADGDYVDIYTAEGHWLKEQTMKYSEELLPPDRFVRTHRSYIVNIHHISRIERYGEQHLIILSKGEKIKISNARYQVLKQRLGL